MSRSAPAEILDQLAGNLFQEARGDAHLRGVVAVAAAIVGAGEDQRIHGAGHADVAEAALFFQFVGIVERARVGEEALFQAGQKDQRKLQALGGVQRHQRDAGVGVELVGVGGQGRVVEKLGQRLAAGLGVVGGVGQFLQVFNAAEGLRRAFGLQGFDVAGAVDEEADQLGEGGGVAGGAKGAFARSFSSSDRILRRRSPVSKSGPGAPGLLVGHCREMAAWAARRRAKSWRRRAAESGPFVAAKVEAGGGVRAGGVCAPQRRSQSRCPLRLRTPRWRPRRPPACRQSRGPSSPGRRESAGGRTQWPSGRGWG